MNSDRTVAEILYHEQKQRDELVSAAGGLLTASQAAEQLGTTVQDVEDRWRRRELLAVRTESEWHYPAVQFAVGGGLVNGLAAAARATVALGSWGALRFLLTANNRLGGRTPLDALNSPGEWSLRARRLLAEVEDSFL